MTRVVPTKALLLPLLGAVILHFLSRTSADPWLALASAALVALPLASVGLQPSLRDVDIQHRGPHRVVAGDSFVVEVVVRNTGDRETPPMRWRHEHPALSPVEVAVPGLAPGEQVALPVQRQALRRGVHTSLAGRLTTTAPFGLLRWSRPHVPKPLALIVHPVTGTTIPQPEGGAATTTAQSIAVPGAGLEILDLRPWRPGDSRREVSARASARHGKPVVLQRERDAGPSIVLLVEGGGAGPTWERDISAAATIAVAAARAGQQVDVLADPPPGRLDDVGLLDFFARVDEVGPIRASDVVRAKQLAGHGGSIIVLSPRESSPVLHSITATGGLRLGAVDVR